MVGLHREGVDVLAREALDGGDQVGADALGHERRGERSRRVGGPGAAVAAHGDAAHRLDAAGEDQVLEATADARRGLVDGLETRGAEAVQLYAGDRVGVARGECRGLGDVAALVTDRRDDTEHDVVDAVHVEGRVAVLHGVEQTDDQVDRLDLVEAAVLLPLAPGRADRVVHERFCHVLPCFHWRLLRRRGRARGCSVVRRQPDAHCDSNTVIVNPDRMWARSPEALTDGRSAQPRVRVAVPAPAELRCALADPQRGHASIRAGVSPRA